MPFLRNLLAGLVVGAASGVIAVSLAGAQPEHQTKTATLQVTATVQPSCSTRLVPAAGASAPSAKIDCSGMAQPSVHTVRPGRDPQRQVEHGLVVVEF